MVKKNHPGKVKNFDSIVEMKGCQTIQEHRISHFMAMRISYLMAMPGFVIKLALQSSYWVMLVLTIQIIHCYLDYLKMVSHSMSFQT